jgi:LAS superfamily LD-carboxypeptidase LdcB
MATRTSARKKTAGGTRKSEARGRRKVARKSAASARAPRRAASRAATIDVVFKGLLAIEPPINRNPDHLDPAFRAKLEAALADLATQGSPFKFVEGFRTVERQQWLFGSGRPNAVPFGRAGTAPPARARPPTATR